MNIHNIFDKISPVFRNRRFRTFLEKVRPGPEENILDVGGYPQTWTPHAPCGKKIDVLNIHAISYDSSAHPNHNISTVIGDACRLTYPDKSYDIVFSNSVIEHVGTWENQRKFADEVRRVGKKLWIQTPAAEFFIEPHYIAPFVHWLPKSLRKKVLRPFTPWGWITRPTKERVQSMIDEIRLISRKEMKQLFPDCEILTEKFLFIFPKSYVAFRRS